MRNALPSVTLVALVACEGGQTWYEQRWRRAGIEASTADIERSDAREQAHMHENGRIINRSYGQ